MDETRINAQLPQLDVEIVRRDYPDDRAEVMTIKMTATPSFKAVGGMMTQGVAGPMTGLWSAPLLLWAGMVQAAWAPMLGAMMPRITAQIDSPTAAPGTTRKDANGASPGSD